jgi:hypothetical protein
VRHSRQAKPSCQKTSSSLAVFVVNVPKQPISIWHTNRPFSRPLFPKEKITNQPLFSLQYSCKSFLPSPIDVNGLQQRILYSSLTMVSFSVRVSAMKNSSAPSIQSHNIPEMNYFGAMGGIYR